jgi:hypothetical protein
MPGVRPVRRCQFRQQQGNRLLQLRMRRRISAGVEIDAAVGLETEALLTTARRPPLR